MKIKTTIIYTDNPPPQDAFYELLLKLCRKIKERKETALDCGKAGRPPKNK
jgi:hypothetical protein